MALRHHRRGPTKAIPGVYFPDGCKLSRDCVSAVPALVPNASAAWGRPKKRQEAAWHGPGGVGAWADSVLISCHGREANRGVRPGQQFGFLMENPAEACLFSKFCTEGGMLRFLFRSRGVLKIGRSKDRKIRRSAAKDGLLSVPARFGRRREWFVAIYCCRACARAAVPDETDCLTQIRVHASQAFPAHSTVQGSPRGWIPGTVTHTFAH